MPKTSILTFSAVDSIVTLLLCVIVAMFPGGHVFAQERALKDILAVFIDIIDVVIPLIMLAALVFFMLGAIRLIYGAGNDQSRNAAKQTMIWGTIALFCMVAIWGIVVIIQKSFFAGL